MSPLDVIICVLQDTCVNRLLRKERQQTAYLESGMEKKIRKRTCTRKKAQCVLFVFEIARRLMLLNGK